MFFLIYVPQLVQQHSVSSESFASSGTNRSSGQIHI